MCIGIWISEFGRDSVSKTGLAASCDSVSETWLGLATVGGIWALVSEYQKETEQRWEVYEYPKSQVEYLS